MSGKLHGAVLKRGPKDTSRWTLAVLAEDADDFGFAQMRMERIAEARLAVRETVSRQLAKLAREGWVCIVPKAVDGCGNVYFLNLSKIGAGPGPKSRKSPLHREFLANTGDKWQGARFTQPLVQKPVSPCDIAQGGHVTEFAGHVTLAAEACDIPQVAYKEAPLFPVLPVDPRRKYGDDDGEGIFSNETAFEADPAVPEGLPKPRPAAPPHPALSTAWQESWSRFRSAIDARSQSDPLRQACQGWTLRGLATEGNWMTLTTDAPRAGPLRAVIGASQAGAWLGMALRTAFYLPPHIDLRFVVLEALAPNEVPTAPERTPHP